MDDEVQGVLTPQVPHLGSGEWLVVVAQDREPLKDIDNTDGLHQHHHRGGSSSAEGNVGDEIAREHELEDVGREVVVQKRRVQV